MSRLVKKFLNWLRGGDVCNDSVTPLENGGASAQGDRNLPHLKLDSDLARNRNTSNVANQLSNTVSLEQMVEDDVFNSDDISSGPVEDQSGDMENPGEDLDHSVSTHDSEVHTNVSCKASEKRRQNSQVANRNTPKKRTLDEEYDDSNDLACSPSKKCRNSVRKESSEQLEADDTNRSQESQDTSAAPAVTTAEEQSQAPKRIPKRKKKRAARRRGKKTRKVLTTRRHQ